MKPETLTPEHLAPALEQAHQFFGPLVLGGMAVGVVSVLLGLSVGSLIVSMHAARSEKSHKSASSLEADLRDLRHDRIERQRMGRELKALIAEGDEVRPPRVSFYPHCIHFHHTPDT